MKLKDIEKFTLALPGAKLDFPWGEDHRVYKVGGKMFVSTGGKMNAEAQLSFKCTDLAYEMLIKRKGLVPAPYLARAKWVHLEDPKVMDAEELKARITEAHRLIVAKLPKKVRETLGASS